MKCFRASASVLICMHECLYACVQVYMRVICYGTTHARKHAHHQHKMHECLYACVQVYVRVICYGTTHARKHAHHQHKIANLVIMMN